MIPLFYQFPASFYLSSPLLIVCSFCLQAYHLMKQDSYYSSVTCKIAAQSVNKEKKLSVINEEKQNLFCVHYLELNYNHKASIWKAI